MTTRKNRKTAPNRMPAPLRRAWTAAMLLAVLAVGTDSPGQPPGGETDHTAAFGHLTVGDAMPPFRLRTAQGGDYDAAARLRGKTCALIFWRTDQEFSKLALQALKKTRDELKSKDLEVVAICSGQTPAAEVQQGADDAGIDFPVLLDPDRTVYGQMGIRVHPATGFFDRDGKLRFVYGGYRRDFPLKTRACLEMLLGRISEGEFTAQMDPDTGGMPIHAQHALADYNLGMDLIRQKKYAEAKNCLKKAWTCETPVVSAGIEYGFLCLKSRDDSEALDIFGRILEKTAGSPRALAGKGIALVHTGQGDEGMRLLEPLLQDGFDEPLAYYTAAAFLETQGKCEKALVYYRRGLQIIVDIDQEE